MTALTAMVIVNLFLIYPALVLLGFVLGRSIGYHDGINADR